MGLHSAGPTLQGGSCCCGVHETSTSFSAIAHRDCCRGGTSTCCGLEGRCCTPVLSSSVLPPVTKAFVLHDFQACDWLALPTLEKRELASPVAWVLAAESPPSIGRSELAHRVLLI